MCNRTQNDVIWGLIALFLTSQIAGNTSDFKMDVTRHLILFSNFIQILNQNNIRFPTFLQLMYVLRMSYSMTSIRIELII